MSDPVGLQSFQTIIDPSTLYAVAARASVNLNRSEQSAVQLEPNIQVAGNSADIYGSQVLPDSPPINMTKIFSGVLNIKAFDYVPNYLYVDPVSSDPSAIILTGVTAEEIL